MALTLSKPSVIAGCLALLAAAAPARAEHYTKPPLAVMPADKVLNTAPLTARPLSQTEQLKLTRAPQFPAESAATMNGTFEVRIFRVNDATDAPLIWKRGQDDCDVFLTMVFHGVRFTGDIAPITPLSDPHWLAKSPEGFFSTGHWLLVIEQDTPPERNADRRRGRWEVFRLGIPGEKAYFARGVPFAVEPEGGCCGPPRPGPEEAALVQRALDTVAQAIAAEFNCYQASPVGAASAATTQLALTACPVAPAADQVG